MERDLDAAVSGGAAEQLNYAKDLNDGILVRRNYAQAFRWFKSAAQLGSVEATAWLGSMYLLGNGVPADPQKAHDLIATAAHKNDRVGLRFLGLMSEQGVVETQDYSLALKYYQRASALGDANSFDKRGQLRLSGLGAPRSRKIALVLFSKGAALGDQWAQLHLGLLYRSGISNETPIEYNLAQHWLQASAAQNNRVALFVLGNMASLGQGVPPNEKLAFTYFELSAAHRYAPADLALGYAHEVGRGTEVNLLHAYVGYALAAEQGNADGENALRALTSHLSMQDLQQAQLLLSRFKLQSGEAPHLTATTPDK